MLIDILIFQFQTSFDFKLRRYLRGIKFPKEYRNTMFLSSISINELEELFNEKINIDEFFEDLKIFNQKCEKLNYFDKTLMYYVQYYLPDLVCARADRAGMLNSLEIRSPFLNPKILNFVLTRSNKEKADLFQTKKMLRNLLKRKLPKSHVDTDKTGFTFPIQSWLDIEKIKNFENLNSQKLMEMRKKHLSGKTEYRNFFYSLLSINSLNN